MKRKEELKIFGAVAILVLFCCISFGAASPIALTPNKTTKEIQTTNTNTMQTGGRDYTHTVLAEESTATWCPYCPAVVNWLSQLYNQGYNFQYVALVDDVNGYAHNRLVEYNYYYLPTVYYDAGYQTVIGADNIQYEINALNACGARTVANIDLALNVLWLGNAQLGISMNLTNHQAAPYSGRIRVYVTEINSRWYVQGTQYHHAMIGNFAINQNVNVPAGQTATYTTTWNGNTYGFGNIVQNNIMVVAAAFNATAHIGYSSPGDTNKHPFNAYWVDETTAATPIIIPNPPSQPTGPVKGIAGHGVQYSYSTNSTAGNDLYYKFFWGDGSDSGWIGPYASGVPASASYNWPTFGTYQVTAVVKIGLNGVQSVASTPLSIRMYKLGDINGDDVVNFGDINPFVLALSGGETGYYAAYPDGYYYTADCNLDGVVNFADINPFVAILSGG